MLFCHSKYKNVYRENTGTCLSFLYNDSYSNEKNLLFKLGWPTIQVSRLRKLAVIVFEYSLNLAP